ncbi:MAG: hypothetical protein IJ091_00445 [Oscillospiraceae bacterium]|nr:hypothetical protein [Oscillospiraceae bacterium]
MAINDYHELYQQHADQLIMAAPASDCPAGSDSEVQKEGAAKYTEEFANKERPAILSNYDKPGPDFEIELHKLTREKFDAAS